MNYLGDSLIKVLREFGIVGLVTYVGGILILGGFVREQDFKKQLIIGAVGVLLLSLSVFIAFFRLKIQKEREKALIQMAESTCNRLAEQLGKNLSNEQVFGIIQKIRQTQKDLIRSIVKKNNC